MGVQVVALCGNNSFNGEFIEAQKWIVLEVVLNLASTFSAISKLTKLMKTRTKWSITMTYLTNLF